MRVRVLEFTFIRVPRLEGVSIEPQLIDACGRTWGSLVETTGLRAAGLGAGPMTKLAPPRSPTGRTHRGLSPSQPPPGHIPGPFPAALEAPPGALAEGANAPSDFRARRRFHPSAPAPDPSSPRSSGGENVRCNLMHGMSRATENLGINC